MFKAKIFLSVILTSFLFMLSACITEGDKTVKENETTAESNLEQSGNKTDKITPDTVTGSTTVIDRDLNWASKNPPKTPVIRIDKATDIVLDGSIDEKAWKKAKSFDRFGLDDGLGLLEFPTSIKFLQDGRTLWIALDCEIPNGKDGKPVEGAMKREGYELWLDNTYSRKSFHHIFFNLNGWVSSPGISPELMKEAFQTKFNKKDNSYTAEIKIDLDKFDQLGTPNKDAVGFNIARECRGGWATLAGIIGQAHKPRQFWTLDLSGKMEERLPVDVYGTPFKEGTDIKKMARLLIEAWEEMKVSKNNPSYAIMQIKINRLKEYLKKDEKSSWSLDSQIAAITRSTMKTLLMTIHIIDNTKLFTVQAALKPGQPFPETQWKEAAYISDVDNTPQPYSLFTPKNYDNKESYPLIIYLHGSGNSHIGEGVVFERYSSDDHRYFKVKTNGRRARRYGPLAEKDLFDVIEDVKSRYNIDDSRICLIGYSAGCYAVYNFASKYPEKFAAVAGLAGGSIWGNETNLTPVNTMLVCGFDDPIVKFNRNGSRNILNMKRE